MINKKVFYTIRNARTVIHKLAFDVEFNHEAYQLWKRKLKKALAQDLLNFMKEYDGDWEGWSSNAFEGDVGDDAIEALREGDSKFGIEKSSDTFREIIERLQNPREILAKKKKKKEPKKPKKVKEIADAIRRDNKDVSDGVAYAQAWETYCSYVNPGYDGCTSKGKSKRKSPKSARD